MFLIVFVVAGLFALYCFLRVGLGLVRLAYLLVKGAVVLLWGLIFVFPDYAARRLRRSSKPLAVTARYRD